MKRIAIISTLIILSAFCFSQSTELSLISTSGGVFENDNISLTFAVGEVVSETFSTNNLYLTQGFLQSYTAPTAVRNEAITNAFDINLYPNPASQFIYLEIEALNDVTNSDYSATLLDINGKTMATIVIEGASTKIDISQYSSGSYFVRMNKTGQTKMFQKINK